MRLPGLEGISLLPGKGGTAPFYRVQGSLSVKIAPAASDLLGLFCPARRTLFEISDLFRGSLEFDLLTFLARHPGKVFTRHELLLHVWGYTGFVGDIRAVDVNIRRLREKIEDDPADPAVIVTRRGRGYLFAL